MCIELFFETYKNTISFAGAVGTVVAAFVAVWVVFQNSKDLRRIRLAGLSVTEIDDNGVLYLQNSTDIDLKINTSICRSVLDEHERKENFHEVVSSSSWLKSDFEIIHKEMVLSKGERIAIHLKNIVVEEAYISLVALRVKFSEDPKKAFKKSKYYLFRFAGERARLDSAIAEISHPHNKWVLECSKIEKS